MILYEAIKEVVPIYNVQLDVSNSKALSDLFAWISRPGVPFSERSMLVDDVLAQLKYKMHILPQEALVALQDFLFEMRDKLREVIQEVMGTETKLDKSVVGDLQEKLNACSEMIMRLAPKVGTTRTGRCRLVGGLPPGSYVVPDGGVQHSTS